MHGVSDVRKVDVQLASNALVQTFLLQRNPSVTMTPETMITGLETVLDISLCSDHCHESSDLCLDIYGHQVAGCKGNENRDSTA